MKKIIQIIAICALPMLGMAQNTNVLRNPGFEYDSAGNFPGWTLYGPTYGSVVDTNVLSGSGGAHGGANYVQVSPDLTTYNITPSGLYQDYLSGPGATYSADGWAYAPSTNLLAARNSAWIEVTFRDANANVLALYRSSIITNLAGGGFPQNTWVDLSVTNQYDPNTYARTGTVSTLVAPAGTYFVRCQVAVCNDGTSSDGGSVFFDDLQLASTAGASYTGWNLAWSDEFNGTSLDTNTWVGDIGTGTYIVNGQGQTPPGDGWGNAELEYYTTNSSNVYVGGGMLHIIAQQSLNYNGSGKDYTSARIKSQALFSAKYGRIEWRAKLPVGTGCWPALWMLGTNIPTASWPGCGEIDVMENRGTDSTNVQASTHSGGNGGDGYGNDGGIYQFITGQEANVASAFHTYTMDWSTNAIMFYTDGHLYSIVKNWSSSVGHYPVPFNQPFFFIMNLAIGGSYLNWPQESTINSGTAFPVEMDVDYLRIYQQTNTAFVTPPPPQPSLVPATNSVLVYFGSAGGTNDVIPNPTNGLYWNSPQITGVGQGPVPINGSSQPLPLTNAANANSGMTLTINNVTGWDSSDGAYWIDYVGPYPTVLSNIPSAVLRNGITINGGGTVSFTISGLSSTATYNVLFYGARCNPSSGGSVTDFGNTQTNVLTVGTSPSPTTNWFNPYFNSAAVEAWTNVTPSGGQIAFTIKVPSGANGGMLNFLEVAPNTGGTNPPAAPASVVATPGNAQVALTWAASIGATSYNVKRSLTSGAETTITNVTTLSYTDTSVVNGTKYYYTVSAVNAYGESTNNIEVNATPQASLATTTALVNFAGTNNTYFISSPDGNGHYWNNIAGPVSAVGGSIALLNGSTNVALVDTANGNDGWTLAVNQLGPYGYNFGGDAGFNSGPFSSALTAVWPVAALQDGVSVGNTADANGNQISVTISGLNSNLTYNVLFYGNHVDFNGSMQTNTLVVGSTVSANPVSFNSHNNSTTLVEWDNITPGAGGRIVFNVGCAVQGALNAMEIVGQGGSSQPPSASIVSSFSGNTLNLTWPAGHGWRLVSQTNLLAAPAAWSTVSSADGSYSITPSPTNPAVFYRLVNP